MRLVITRLVVLVFLPAIMAAAAPPVAAKTAGQGGGAEWVTVAEESGFEATPSYDETLAWLDRLAESSPAVDLQEFGHSGQGRPLPLVVVSTEQAFEPELARATGKPLVLLQCGIHSGEISGKDATLILLRELLIEGRHPEILDHLILLVVPIYNVDGHERMGQSRINQDGPIRGMGFRTTARGQDLNRDYMKLDSEEARALVGSVVARWDPHLLMDLHTTDGADHRIEVSYSVSQGPLADEGVGAWSTALAQRVAERMEAAGRPVAPYVFGIDRKAPQDGFRGGFTAPRFSTSYMALRGRASILVEAHSLKPYETRVRSVHDYVEFVLAELAMDPGALVGACAAADRRVVEGMAADGDRPKIPLRLVRGDEPRPFVFRSYAFEVVDGEVGGEPYVVYSSEPLDIEAPLRDQVEVEVGLAPPRGYLIPSQYGELVRRLECHGLRLERLGEAVDVDVEMVRLDQVQVAEESYQGRHRVDLTEWTMEEHAARRFPAGTFWLPLDQPLARVAVHLLEPVAPDSFFAWGFLSSALERKEYFERYVMEPMAQQMLADDPALRQEFEQRITEDETFAGDPWARLEFFYRRTEHADPDWRLHPIARVAGGLPEGTVLEAIR